jgi:hypothetical protein
MTMLKLFNKKPPTKNSKAHSNDDGSRKTPDNSEPVSQAGSEKADIKKLAGLSAMIGALQSFAPFGFYFAFIGCVIAPPSIRPIVIAGTLAATALFFALAWYQGHILFKLEMLERDQRR